MSKRNKRFLSLKNRYTTNVIVIIILSVLFSVAQLALTEPIFIRIAKGQLVEAGDNVLGISLEDGDFDKKISEIEADSSTYVELYSPNKETLVYTTNTNSWIYDADTSQKYELRPRIMKIISHEDNPDGSYFEEREEFYGSARYLVYECSKDDETAVVYMSLESITDSAGFTKVILLGFSLWFLITAFVIVTVYSWQIVRPIFGLNRITKKLAGLDFSEQVPETRIPELNELGKSVNSLSKSLEFNLSTLKEKNEQLEREIEKEKQSEEIRKQFIANASHELKTPIAIIQSYAEGIKYDDTRESVEEYSDIIIDEADKMTNLIVRLMEMVKYDSIYFTPAFEEFDLSRAIHNFIEPMTLIFAEKGITTEVEIPDNIKCYGDRDLLRQVFSNYISNAISHCEGEKIIRISLEPGRDFSTVKVYNTGKHIDEQDLPYIWQSFYRADKAHSRAEGRFGLGLSIVKTIQEIHNCKYGVENVDGGVEFSFEVRN